MTLLAPCDWPVDLDGCDCEVLFGLEPEKQQAIVDMASFILWAATHHQFGPCETTVYPCSDTRVCCGRCGGSGFWTPKCGCRSVSELVLPGPVVSIVSVFVDGHEVDPATYRVDDYAWLVNLTGSWPKCGDILTPFDEGGFAVTYTMGFPPPAGAGTVTAELACQLAKAVCGDASCLLPQRIAQKTRQGVTVTFDDLADGKTGIMFIDMWVASVNNRSRPGRVFTPDIKPPRTATWPTAATSPGSP